ncbi:hypothetical protein [Streptomyces sp. NK08204]|uniref:hypothetical protein n=1 Tax=Streptomyces sp. NK08204 TaxID=2873260 RepID=UPI001CEC7325|nr:hypothetical protein [Streptomyces sp. NK08204]
MLGVGLMAAPWPEDVPGIDGFHADDVSTGISGGRGRPSRLNNGGTSIGGTVRTVSGRPGRPVRTRTAR